MLDRDEGGQQQRRGLQGQVQVGGEFHYNKKRSQQKISHKCFVFQIKREPSLSSDSDGLSDDTDDSDVDVDGIDEDAATLAAALENNQLSVVLDIQVSLR